jgi:hypothetical protein
MQAFRSKKVQSRQPSKHAAVQQSYKRCSKRAGHSGKRIRSRLWEIDAPLSPTSEECVFPSVFVTAVDRQLDCPVQAKKHS